MRVKHAMILAAGLGTRMRPLTLKTPKPLIKIGSKNLLERSIKLLEAHGVEQITINVHYLADQIEKFISNLQSKVQITISNEKDLLLDTGGGVKEATRIFNKNPFFVLNPDTLWVNNYLREMKSLENIYFEGKKHCLLLVDKKLSLDTSFKGDFNLDNNVISKNIKNKFIFTGLQLIDRNCLNYIDKKIFSMNEVWNKLINENKLFGFESSQKFYHLNTEEMYKKILNLNITD
jgi:MurNAc alpha-1-phosphate uridylyltransferase|tara:strand:+ start:1225 stop:1923 length:699 start_codon:yes stop_codon:yes gene_type:complete